jgi:cell division protease FtsH
MAVGEAQHEVFLGRDFGSRREVSEQMAQMVDGEVKRLLDEAYVKAMELLTEHRDLLERITDALLERETIDREDLALLEKNQPLPPRSAPPPPAPPATPAPAARADTAPIRPVLGAPPAEPAGA